MRISRFVISIGAWLFLIFGANLDSVQGKIKTAVKSQPQTLKRSYKFVDVSPASFQINGPAVSLPSAASLDNTPSFRYDSPGFQLIFNESDQPNLPLQEDQLQACWYDSSGARTGTDYCRQGNKLPPCGDAVCQLNGGGNCGAGDYARVIIIETKAECPVTFTPSTTDANTNSLGMKFADIPAGTFQMGSTKNSDEIIHPVTLSRGFYLGRTEVTQAEWVAVMGSNPSYFKNCDNCLVEQVSWEDVQEFIQKLNAKGEGTYRLPTEAEWEYAARAGTTGDYAGDLDSIGWYDKNSEDTTHEVATKQPNAWGLYDMYGNVWEWVEDWYGGYPGGSVSDPTGASSGLYRVYRGGSWLYEAGYARSALRFLYTPSYRYYDLGFRVVRTK